MIRLEDTKNYPVVYVITYHNGMIDGHKYYVLDLRTDYMSFQPSYGTSYFETFDEAETELERLNLNGVK